MVSAKCRPVDMAYEENGLAPILDEGFLVSVSIAKEVDRHEKLFDCLSGRTGSPQATAQCGFASDHFQEMARMIPGHVIMAALLIFDQENQSCMTLVQRG